MPNRILRVIKQHFVEAFDGSLLDEEFADLEFVHALRMCAVVAVPLSTFYDWAAGSTVALQARQAADAELTVVIEQTWRDSRRTYGWPRGVSPVDPPPRDDGVSSTGGAESCASRGFVGASTPTSTFNGPSNATENGA